MLFTNNNFDGQRGQIMHDDGYDDDYNVSSGCKHYSPRSNSSIMDMTDYSTCDNCRHMRMDNRCGIAERTLA